MANIEFTKDFATKKKGDTWDNCPNLLASRLINIDKVAKLVKEKTSKKE